MLKKVITPLYNLFGVYNSFSGFPFSIQRLFSLIVIPPIFYFVVQIDSSDSQDGLVEISFIIGYVILVIMLINKINKHGNRLNIKKENNIDKIIFPAIGRILFFWLVLFLIYKGVKLIV